MILKKDKKTKEEVKQSKAKRIFKRICFTLLGLIAAFIIILLITFIVLWQDPVWQSHIKAAYTAFTVDKDDISNTIEKTDEDRRESINSAGLYIDKGVEEALLAGKITEQQFSMILSKKLTLEEAIEINKSPQPPDDKLTEQNPETQPPQQDEVENTDSSEQTQIPDEQAKPKDDKEPSEKPENKPVQDTKPPKTPATDNTTPQTPSQSSESATDEKVAELVTKMYVLKNDYIGRINGVVDGMKAEFAALPKEQRTTSAKQSIASKHMSEINAMEAQCDAQVNSIVTELRSVLKEAGRDTTLADKILSTYATEKENTKAYYIATYGD